MDIIVLIKEVPDMNNVRFDSERGLVDRQSADSLINPFDLHALQAAVNIKKEVSATITAITMGPKKADKSLKEAYARGADRLVLVSDKKFAGSDTLATSRTLTAAIKTIGSYDLILCGEKSVDGDTAQVGAEVAALLGIPQCYYAERLELSENSHIYATAENIGGYKQIRKMKLPALICVSKNIAFPEMPGVKRKLQSLKQKVEIFTYNELSKYLNEAETGLAGSPTKVDKIVVPKPVLKNSLITDNEADFIKLFMQSVRG